MFLLAFFLRIEEFTRLERLISGAHVSGIKSPSLCGSPGAPTGSFSGLGPSAGGCRGATGPRRPAAGAPEELLC